MKYYYFPSSYFGFRGRGYGGAMRGYGSVGYIVGAGYGGVADVQPVDPNLLAANLPANDKAVQAMSEASKKPAELPKGKASWWKRLGAKVKGAYEGAKNKVKNMATGAVNTVGSFIGKTAWSPMQLVQAYNAYKNPEKAWERIAKAGLGTLPSLIGAFNPLKLGVGYGKGVCNMINGCGYRSGGRLKKGSKEAKAYMAYLRSLKRT